jgi:hypothetical protein
MDSDGKVVPFRPRHDPRVCWQCGCAARPVGTQIEWRTTVIPAVAQLRAYGLWKHDWSLEDLGPVIAWSCSHDHIEAGEVFVVPVTTYGIPEADEWCVVGNDGRVEGTPCDSVTDWAAGVRAWHEANDAGTTL